jgi:ribonuclease BN (tRNA processing enzyme)
MCLVSEACRHAISRREFLRQAGTLAAAPIMMGAGAGAHAAPAPVAAPLNLAGDAHTKLVLLGTTGGPTWWPVNPSGAGGPERASASSALVVGDAMYIVDLGQGSAQRLAQAFNVGTFNAEGVQAGYQTYLLNLKAIFFTHLHMDHTTDYPAILTCGYSAGIGSSLDPNEPAVPVQVYGPGNRGQLEADLYKLRVPVVNPRNPTPGTVEMTDYLWQAYAQAINDFTRDNGWPDFTRLFDVHDIVLPRHLPGFKSPNKTPCVQMVPFEIFRDRNVVVHAILVDHHQVFPSYAFRFDTADGSVVFSGDTGPDTRGNLQRLAAGADILVHEVIDPAWIDATFGPPGTWDQATEALVTHLETAHTLIGDVGAVAQDAGVDKLVLSHIVPGNAPLAHLLGVKGFEGELIIGQDLMQIPVG